MKQLEVNNLRHRIAPFMLGFLFSSGIGLVQVIPEFYQGMNSTTYQSTLETAQEMANSDEQAAKKWKLVQYSTVKKPNRRSGQNASSKPAEPKAVSISNNQQGSSGSNISKAQGWVIKYDHSLSISDIMPYTTKLKVGVFAIKNEKNTSPELIGQFYSESHFSNDRPAMLFNHKYAVNGKIKKTSLYLSDTAQAIFCAKSSDANDSNIDHCMVYTKKALEMIAKKVKMFCTKTNFDFDKVRHVVLTIQSGQYMVLNIS